MNWHAFLWAFGYAASALTWLAVMFWIGETVQRKANGFVAGYCAALWLGLGIALAVGGVA